jgi:EcsC family protein
MATSKLDQSTLLKALNWAYDQALAGVPGVGVDSAVTLADDYRRRSDSPGAAATRLVRRQVAKAGTSGFIAGLGGVLTLPLAIPVNLASVLVLQLRMIAAVAHLGGHDVRSDEVRTMAFACLCGTAAFDVLKGVGIQIGRKLTEQTIKKLSGELIKKINQAVGFRLVTRFGEKGLLNLSRLIPFAGGIVGGGFDASSTLAIGTVAQKMFITLDAQRAAGADIAVTDVTSPPASVDGDRR